MSEFKKEANTEATEAINKKLKMDNSHTEKAIAQLTAMKQIKRNLSKDTIAYIGTYLSYKDKRSLASVCRWFNDNSYPVSSHATQLLSRVVRGDLATVEKFFNSNTTTHIIAVLNKPVTITDLSDRIFPYITVFQYAVWALDKPMWELILRYLPKERACSQLKALEKNRADITKAHGMHFSFDLIVERLQHYRDHFDRWDREQRVAYWCKKVGSAQREFPGWLVMMMCEEGSNVAWTKQDLLQRVARNLEHLEWFFSQEFNGGPLGSRWAAARGMIVGGVRTLCYNGLRYGFLMYLQHDRDHLANISLARSRELAQLKAQLSSYASSLDNLEK